MRRYWEGTLSLTLERRTYACKRCGKVRETTSYNAKYCGPCAEEVGREQSRKRREKIRNGGKK